MMDCKKALAESNGDVAKALDWLRAKGIARAASGADRVALEGLIALHIDASAKSATLVEVNSETDFVSRNKDFQAFCSLVARTAAKSGAADVAALMSQPCTSSASGAPTTIKDALTDVVIAIRENIVVRRVSTISSVDGGVLAGYVHGKVGEVSDGLQMGKTAAVVSLKPAASGSASALTAVEAAGRRLAMHVVAAKPLYLSEASVPPDVMQREEEISKEQLQTSGQLQNKKPDVVAKIVRGKVLKRMSEVCLLSQPHVAEEGGPLVGKFLSSLPGATGGVSCEGFTRWALGGH